MKVLVVLGLLAITAVFAAHHHHAKLVKTTIKKKLIGGPDSLPPWLRKNKTAETPVAEQSGFVDDAKATATKVKTTVVEKVKKIHSHVKNHGKKALDWIKSKFNKKNETVAAPAVEQSGFAEVKTSVVEKVKKFHNHAKNHGKKALKWIKSKFSKKNETAEVAPAPEQSGFAEVKTSVVEKVKKAHNHVKNHGKKALKWIKSKFSKKNETAEAAPAVEQSGFADVKSAVVEKVKKVHSHVKNHGKKALKWIKSKFSKKNETAEAAPAPEQSGFAEVKTSVVEKVKKVHNHIKEHGKKALDWIKSKFNKKTEETPAPVVEQSGFAEDAQATVSKVKETTKTFFNKLHNKAKEGYNVIKTKIQEKF